MVSRLHQAGQGPSSRSRLQRDETAAGSQRLRELQQQQHIQTELEWQQSRQEQAQAAAQQAAGYMSRLGEVLAQYDAAYPAGEEAAGLSKEEQKQLSGQLSELMAQADGIEASLQKNAGWLDEEAVQTAQANLKSLLQAAESIPGEMAAYEQGAKDWQQALAYRDGHSLQADIVDPITYYRAGQQGLLGDWEGTSYSQYLQQAGEYMKSMAQTPAQSGEAGKWQEKRMQITSQAIAQQTRKITPDDLAQADAAVAEAEAIRNKQGEGYVVQREDGSQVSAWQNLREKREERDTLNQRYNQQQKGSPTRFDNMTPEQQQTYVFSPNSDYSQAMQQKLTAMQDSTQEEKLAYLEEQGYTWDEIQRLVMAMDPSDTQQDLLDYINENKRYSGMQAAVGNIAQEHPVLASIVSIPANVLGDAVSLAEQVGGLLTGNKVSRNSLGNVLTGAASAARQTVGEQIDNDALRFLYNAGMFAGDMALGFGVDKLGGRLMGRLGLSGLGSVDDSYRASRGLTGYGGDIEELAGRYSGSTRRAFLSGYDGGVDPQTYARGFDFYHGEGRLGMDFDQASSLADELGLGISKSSGFQAHASGVNEAAAKSLTESVATADDIGQILPDQMHNQVYAAGNNATEEVLEDTYTSSSVERNDLQKHVDDDRIGNDINGVETQGKRKPYANSRPSYGKDQIEQVWERAKDPITGKVYDPSGVEIIWDRSKPRNGQWDMGHIPDAKYSEVHKKYMDGEMSKEEFLNWYRDPANYRPELPSTNRSHRYE